jgi:hypothetical protein
MEPPWRLVIYHGRYRKNLLEGFNMKSAYELAMERLNKTSPQAASTLTEAQKKELAEIESVYKAKIAEKEIFLKPKIQEARMQRDASTVESLEKQLRDETKNLREEMEAKKQKVRNQKA